MLGFGLLAAGCGYSKDIEREESKHEEETQGWEPR
jgi:hypothetical protein